MTNVIAGADSMVPTKDDILTKIREEDVKFLQFQFMDILGAVKTVTVPSHRAETCLENGVLFDASSIVGYATIEESDMQLRPDLRTYLTIPWAAPQHKTARLICNSYEIDGKRSMGDPRHVLERMIEKCRQMTGGIFNTGPEYEFFLFKKPDPTDPQAILADHGGYFDHVPSDGADSVRKDMVSALIQMGVDVEAAHHEVAPSQHEIDLRYNEALESADTLMTVKHAVKSIAQANDMHATFMPKPLNGVNGTGMHVHQSIIHEGKNIFAEEGANYGLSDIAFKYLGGLLKYSREICVLCAPTVNSYKRLVPGFEAPVYVSWANQNRSALVRVPAGRGMATRFELRYPDPTGNPYLQFASMLAAGLAGIEEGLVPPEPVEKDLFKMNLAERRAEGIGSLPESLGHALELFRESELMRKTLGDHLFDHFIAVKEKEWDDYRTHVTGWEIRRYLSVY